jgi:hypothetical protein
MQANQGDRQLMPRQSEDFRERMVGIADAVAESARERPAVPVLSPSRFRNLPWRFIKGVLIVALSLGGLGGCYLQYGGWLMNHPKYEESKLLG